MGAAASTKGGPPIIPRMPCVAAFAVGPDLDEAVGLAWGWTKEVIHPVPGTCNPPPPSVRWWPPQEDRSRWDPTYFSPPNSSRCWRAAGSLITHLRARFRAVALDSQPEDGGAWECHVLVGEDQATGRGATGPEAIARAALTAFKMERACRSQEDGK